MRSRPFAARARARAPSVWPPRTATTAARRPCSKTRARAHRRRRNAAMLPDGASRGGVASTSSALPALCAGAQRRQGKRGRGQPALGARRVGAAPAGASQQRRRRLLVSGSATFAVEVADKLSSGYGASLSLEPGGERCTDAAPLAPPQSSPPSSTRGAWGSTRWAPFRCPAWWQAQ